MPGPDDLTDSDFIPRERIQVLDAQSRYEYLLRIIRFLLARGVSFASIEERLAGAGLEPGAAERIVERVVQSLHGQLTAPGDGPEADVPSAVFDALGFTLPGVQLPAGAPLEAHLAQPAPEFAFTRPTDATGATRARARRASQGFVVQVLLVFALFVGLVLFILIR